MRCRSGRTLQSRLAAKVLRKARHLHPRELSRALAALEKAGLQDPALVALAADQVPYRLRRLPLDQRLRVLEGYAARPAPATMCRHTWRREKQCISLTGGRTTST